MEIDSPIFEPPQPDPGDESPVIPNRRLRCSSPGTTAQQQTRAAGASVGATAPDVSHVQHITESTPMPYRPHPAPSKKVAPRLLLAPGNAAPWCSSLSAGGTSCGVSSWGETDACTYPGAVQVIPGLNLSRAHLEALKSAQNEDFASTTISGRAIRRHAAPGTAAVVGPPVQAYADPVCATVVSDEHEELARLRGLIENAVPAEHVLAQQEEHSTTPHLPNKKPPPPPSPALKKKKRVTYSPDDPITPVLHSKEGLADDAADRISERHGSMKVTKKKMTWKDACCGNHAVVLESVVQMDDTLATTQSQYD